MESLSGLFTAADAAGGGGLATLAETLGKIGDVINGEAFQTGLTTVFEGAVRRTGRHHRRTARNR